MKNLPTISPRVSMRASAVGRVGRASLWTPVCGVLLAASGLAFAAEGVDEAAPLAGPQIESDDAPGETRTFGETEMRDRMLTTIRVRPQTFIAALRKLEEDQSEAVALSDKQEEEINGLLAAFRDESAAFRQEHRDELRELTRALRRATQQGRERGARGQESVRSDQTRAEREAPELVTQREQAHARLAEIRESAPSFEPTKAMVWEVLTEPQQAFVQGELDRLVEERYGMAAAPGRTGDGRAERRGGMTVDEQFEQIRARVAALPEAQQRAVLDRLWQALDRIERNRQRAEPPSMDSVDVPGAPRRPSRGARAE